MMSFDLSYYRGTRVLITGGLGFIGSNLAHRLVELGAKVTILDRMSRPTGISLRNFRGIEDKITVVAEDIRNAEVLKRLVPNADVLFNLAGQASYTDSMSDPQLDFDISCLGQISILEACRLKNPKVRIVFASSRMVYRRGLAQPVAEDAATEPLTIYGVHKLTAEHYHRLYANAYGLPTASLRITNPYGPRQRATAGKYGLVNWFLHLASRGEALNIFGDGSQLRDYLYIDDLVEIFLRMGMLPDLSGEVFTAGRGEGVRFRDMAETVIATAGAGHLNLMPWPENYARFETGDFVADVSRLATRINFRPQTTLADGLRRTLRHNQEAAGAGEQP